MANRALSEWESLIQDDDANPYWVPIDEDDLEEEDREPQLLYVKFHFTLCHQTSDGDSDKGEEESEDEIECFVEVCPYSKISLCLSHHCYVLPSCSSIEAWRYCGHSCLVCAACQAVCLEWLAA